MYFHSGKRKGTGWGFGKNKGDGRIIDGANYNYKSYNPNINKNA